MVGKASPHVVGVELGLLEEGGHMVIVEPVLDLIVLPPDGLHQATVAQETQLMRNGGLGDSGCEGQVADTHWPARERVEDLGAGQIAESFEGTHHELEDVVRGQSGSGIGDGGGVDGLGPGHHAF